VIVPVRRECLDHATFGASGSCVPRATQPSTCGAVVQVPALGGLHHRYDRRTARPSRSTAPTGGRSTASPAVVSCIGPTSPEGPAGTTRSTFLEPPAGALKARHRGPCDVDRFW
jgi:hypothetical protein